MAIYKKNTFVLLLFFIYQINCGFSQTPPSNTDWEVISEEDGFITKKKSISGQNIFAFRGEVLADVPISKVISVFLDKNRRKEWVNMFAEQKDLEVTDELNKVYWIRFSLPFFLSDRDYVLELKGVIDNPSKSLTAKIKSTTHPQKKEDSCCIRAHAFGTFYRFEARGKKTYLEVEVNTDPKGWLPSWVVNLIQKKWPKKTLGKLIETAKSPSINADKRFTSWELETP